VHDNTPGGDPMTAPGLNARAWAAALALATALRARLTTPVTGRRWRRPARQCPTWCAADHRCTARHGYPSGEHRSQHLTWQTPYGQLIATRIQTLAGIGHLELTASVRLPPDEGVARWQAQHLPVGVDLVIRAITADPVLPTPASTAARALPPASGTPTRMYPTPLPGHPLPVSTRRAA
jgi:hypothetical protein